MAPIPDPIRYLVHRGRRWRGRAQARRLAVSGVATMAVVTALRRALSETPSAEERAWIARIERLRQALAPSPEPMEILDFGAGGHRFDTGERETAHVVTRTLGDVTLSSKPPRWAYLLFRLTRELRPESVLELGACVGISASYQAAALELNGAGRLLTLEGAPVLAARSAKSIDELGLSHRATVAEGRFTDTIDEAISELKPVEMAFIDGHHVQTATLDYMERIMGAIADEAILVFDDIHWSPGMTNAWNTIAADPRFALTLDLTTLGVAVVSESAAAPMTTRLSYA